MNVAEATTIPRRQEPSDYERIRSDMLAYVQKMSAHQWSDFNLHDPGVTILEQLAYALTDVNARSMLPVEQLLTDKNGQLTLSEHGLFTPEEALSSRPVNERDLQKYLLVCIPELAYVDVSYDQEIPGLIHTNATGFDSSTSQEALTKKIAIAYQNVRNLSEQLASVRLIEQHPCQLFADITLLPQTNPSEVMTAIFSATRKFLLGAVELQPEKEAVSPLTQSDPINFQKLIDSDALDSVEKNRPLSTLMAQLQTVPGIDRVESLVVKEVGTSTNVYQHFLPPAKERTLQLQLPNGAEDNGVLLTQQGRLCDVRFDLVRHNLEKESEHRLMRRRNARMHKQAMPLTVEHLPIANYASVQSQFPSNYGINAYGVPSHSNTERRAQAKQLQGYLLLFDQLLSDHLGMVDHIKNLFSVNLKDQNSYPSTLVADKNAFDLASLQVSSTPDKLIKETVQSAKQLTHKERVLDYLLALNGREHDQFGFDFSAPSLTESEMRSLRLDIKQKSLVKVHDLASSRNSGFNTFRKVWLSDNMSSLERRLRINMGAPDRKTSLLHKPLSLLVSELSQNPTQRNKSLPMQYESLTGQSIAQEERSRVEVPVIAVSDEFADQCLHHWLSTRLSHVRHQWASLLRLGTELSRYRIGRTPKGMANLAIQLGEGNTQQWLYVASSANALDCAKFANGIRHYLQNERKRLDGLHLVEHLLLLPKPLQADVDTRFCCHQLSVVLPSYTERNQNPEFRRFFQHLLLQECPAHLYCHVLWLNHEDMNTFECQYSDWLNLMRFNDQRKEQNQAAAVLRTFLGERIDSDFQVYSGTSHE